MNDLQQLAIDIATKEEIGVRSYFCLRDTSVREYRPCHAQTALSPR
jgi:hypothetical protein